MFQKTLVVALGCGLMTLGCGMEIDTQEQENEEIISNLITAGFPQDDIQIYDGLVYVGRDAHVTLEASREMVEDVDDGQAYKQYRTNNLVSQSIGTICVNGSAYSGTLSSALDMAIDNYNALNLSFSMLRTSSRNAAGCDVTITAKVVSGVGGSAGFPKGGSPYKTINIGSGTAAYGVNTTEHVITHELGHCVGFRHSDYYDRSISCGSGGNEGSAGVGAVHIPGTPETASVGGSVMNSCFRANETGEFTNTDKTALQYLY